jgi:outer membrane protein W
MKKLIIVISIICFGSSLAKAQSSLVAVSYSMGFGAGDMGTFNGNASFRGATFEYRKNIQPNVTLGFEVGWNVFYEAKPYDTYNNGTVSVSGKQYRYQNQVPLLVTANYYFSPGEKFNPFVGVGVGTMYSRRNTDMNLYTLEEQAWHFAVKPEVGFLYQLQPELAAFVAVKYYNGFQAGDFKQTQSYITLNIGLAFTR